MSLIKNRIIAVACGLALAAGGASAQSLRPNVSFNPYTNVNDPFSNLRVISCTIPGVQNLSFAPGVYREPKTFDFPAVLNTSTPGTAVIGDMGLTRTSFKVMSWNLHLFGSFPLPVWQDETRAVRIGNYLNSERAAGRLDFAGLQEVWSTPEDTLVFVNAGFNFLTLGDNSEGSDVLGSGLMQLSPTPMFGFAQGIYDHERGTDASSSKGWTQQTVVKDGFSIGIFNTHLQSGTGTEDAQVRLQQAGQLALSIQIYRALNPTHPVIVMGDFNISVTSNDYIIHLRNIIGFNAAAGESSQFGDVAGNLGPCAGDFNQCTSCSDNPVHQYFYGDSGGSGRIDFIFYNHSRDGSVRVLPKAYDRRRPTTSPAISGDGWAPDNCLACGLTSNVMSDHDAIFAEFELHRD